LDIIELLSIKFKVSLVLFTQAEFTLRHLYDGMRPRRQKDIIAICWIVCHYNNIEITEMSKTLDKLLRSILFEFRTSMTP